MKLILLITFLALSAMYIKHALHIFQQNRYEFERYTKWLLQIKNYHLGAYFSYIAFVYIVGYFLSDYISLLDNGVGVIIVTIIFAIKNINDELHKEYIKPLVYTPRVKRQLVTISILDILLVYLLIYIKLDYIFIATLVPLSSWLLIYLMAIINLPMENAIKKHYENEARDILNTSPNLTKIGITGSFGKTSTKNIVENIISEKYYTLKTPASFNTPMGITITVRNDLKPIHEVFVCEMGADHVGEISYLMDFVKPKYGIVTSIGPQHLNTFHSLENIINEKMQMIEKLPSDGLGIINVDNEYIRNYQIKNNVKTVTIGIENDADFKADNIQYDINGSSFDLIFEGNAYHMNTILLGVHNIMNILAGIAISYHMGMSIEEIQNAVSNIQKIEHRLELKKFNNYTFIDNAFNSNPVGCKLSLDVLSKMPNRHIIITPGLIDLGSKEFEYNFEFGAYMKERADFVILVGFNTSKAIVEGLKSKDFDMENVKVVGSVKEAFNYVYTNFLPTDTILLENDLPDAFL